MDIKKKERRLYRQSEDFAKEIYGYVLGLESDGIAFKDIKYKKNRENGKGIGRTVLL